MRYIISSLLTSVALSLPAMAAPLVVADTPPVQSLVAAVMGDLGAPELLLDKGASEHHFQLRPSQASSIAKADLLVMIGPALTPWIEKAVEKRGNSGVLELLAVKGTHLRDYGAAAEDHDHADKHNHETHDHGHEHEDHHEHDHDHSGLDPHAWLDPENAKLWLDAIAAALAAQDAENAAIYLANAEAAKAEIAAADKEAKALLAPHQNRPLVAYHDAYGYFAEHYGLNVIGTVALGDGSSPGVKHLGDLRSSLAETQEACLLPEAQHDDAAMIKLTKDHGLAMGSPLDPIGSTLEIGPALYPALLVQMAQSIADCGK